MGNRSEALAALAAVMLAVDRPHPVRVAVDGCSAAGKTTLADELAALLRGRTERTIIRVGADPADVVVINEDPTNPALRIRS